MVLSEDLSALPYLRDTTRLHGEVQSQTTSPWRTTTISIFFIRKRNSVAEKIPVGHSAVFLFAFSKQRYLN